LLEHRFTLSGERRGGGERGNGNNGEQGPTH
jgi:hypothetical protein